MVSKSAVRDGGIQISPAPKAAPKKTTKKTAAKKKK